jgi:uncharacterized protein YjcR
MSHKNPNRAEAIKLFKQGWTLRQIGEAVGAHPRTVRDWTLDMDRTVGPHYTGRVSANRELMEGVKRREERLAKFGHEYNDLHVQLLGDPPPHRSALAQRQQGRAA